MSYSPIAYTIPNYRDYKNYWLKAYEPDTTTPKVISFDEDGSVEVSKVKFNKDGFPVSSSNALVIPHIEGRYDLWAFPTEDDADNNDTSNALRFADDLQGGNVNESVDSYLTLAGWQSSTNPKEGDQVSLVERTTGNNGGFIGVVIAGTSTADGIGVIAHNTLVFSLVVIDQTGEIDKYGAIKGEDVTTIVQYVADNLGLVSFPPNTAATPYIIDSVKTTIPTVFILV